MRSPPTLPPPQNLERALHTTHMQLICTHNMHDAKQLLPGAKTVLVSAYTLIGSGRVLVQKN